MMQVTVHQQADDFLKVVHQILLKDEAANNLMLGIALQLQNRQYPGQTEPYLATVSDEHGLILAALRTPPHPLTLYQHRNGDHDAYDFLAQDLMARMTDLTAVSGRTPVAQEFAEVWAALTNQLAHAQMRMRIFELQHVKLKPISPGDLRQATQNHLDLVINWVRCFITDANLHDDPAQVPQMVQRKIEAGAVYLWELDGKPVSMAASARPMEHGVTVNLVYTPPELRGRGYATSCVSALSQKLLDVGWSFCALFTDLANPTSNGIYQRIGYEPICDFDEYVFKSMSVSS